jgi:hypothetical protein
MLLGGASALSSGSVEGGDAAFLSTLSSSESERSRSTPLVHNFDGAALLRRFLEELRPDFPEDWVVASDAWSVPDGRIAEEGLFSLVELETLDAFRCFSV